MEKQLADSESVFLKRLDDLLRRKVVSKAESERINKGSFVATAFCHADATTSRSSVPPAWRFF